MTKIITNPNCGNSPKMSFLQDFKIAFVQGDLDFLGKGITDDITWEIIGEKTVKGKKSFMEEIIKSMSSTFKELKIDQVLSHGKEGAINGKITTLEGTSIAFSEFFLFNGAKGAKIKSITSYKIEQ